MLSSQTRLILRVETMLIQKSFSNQTSNGEPKKREPSKLQKSIAPTSGSPNQKAFTDNINKKLIIDTLSWDFNQKLSP